MTKIKQLNINYIDYVLNGNGTCLYIHNKKNQIIFKIFKNEWNGTYLETKNGNATITDIVNDDMISYADIISNTTKKIGINIIENPDLKTTQIQFNEFNNSDKFNTAINNNYYNINSDSDKYHLFKKECPYISLLIGNLFINEDKEVIENFFTWLYIMFYKNKHQDIFFLFKGTNNKEQGQGSGKGILRILLNELLGGLITNVTNSSYTNNFNSQLQNKKLIIFDEVNFKTLKYEIIKDITGNENLVIEYKGKEPLICKNVSSWILFSNESDLLETIDKDDRRTFIIEPNSINGSLIKIIDKMTDIKDMDDFVEKCKLELNKFLHIIALYKDSKLKTPSQLITQGNINYFINKDNEKEKEKFIDFWKYLYDEEMKKKLIELIREYTRDDYNNLIRLINKKILTKDIFNEITNILKKNGYSTSKKTFLIIIQFINSNNINITLDKTGKKLNPTKKWKGFSYGQFIYNNNTKNYTKGFSTLLRDRYGTKIQ